jgi:hypothetical protein
MGGKMHHGIELLCPEQCVEGMRICEVANNQPAAKERESLCPVERLSYTTTSWRPFPGA